MKPSSNKKSDRDLTLVIDKRSLPKENNGYNKRTLDELRDIIEENLKLIEKLSAPNGTFRQQQP